MGRYDPLLDHKHILGSSFVTALNGKVIFKDGKHTYSKHQLVRAFQTGNYRAAGLLMHAMKTCGYTKVEQLFDVPPEDLAGIKNVGVTTLFVLICIGEARGIDVEKWWGGKISFVGMKIRERRREQDAVDHKKARTRRILRSAGSRILKMAKTGTHG